MLQYYYLVAIFTLASVLVIYVIVLDFGSKRWKFLDSRFVYFQASLRHCCMFGQ